MSRKPACYSLAPHLRRRSGFVARRRRPPTITPARPSIIVVGNYPGGGFDIYARAVARHLGRHIPGNPTIVVKNMPGAGSAKAGYHVSTIAPKDGLTIGAITPGAIIGPLLDDKPDINVRSDQGHLSRHRQYRRAHLRHLRQRRRSSASTMR